MVAIKRQWWNEKVFVEYPTWEEAVEHRCGYFGNRPVKNNSPILNRYFGEGSTGPGNYAKSVEHGIGWEVLAKMIPENINAIGEALRVLPLPRRAKARLERKAARERQVAESDQRRK